MDETGQDAAVTTEPSGGPVDTLLVAAGSGKRMGDAFQGRSKVLLPLAGKPLLLYSLESLVNSGLLRQIVLVYRREDRSEIKDILRAANLSDLIGIVPGGAERFDSVFIGLQALSMLPGGPPETVLIHDAARPFLTRRLIEESIEQARTHGAATVAIPLSDTLKRGREGMLCETLAREDLYRIQTPQTFKFDLLLKAHLGLRQNPDPTVTDDCMLLERQGHPIALVLGEEINLKITTPVDLHIAEAILTGLTKHPDGYPRIRGPVTEVSYPSPWNPTGACSVMLLSERARLAISRAKEVALQSSNHDVDTAHLLLGLIMDPGSIAGTVLRNMGVNLDHLKERILGSVRDASSTQETCVSCLSSNGRDALRLARHEADSLGLDSIGAEHLLLGIIRVTDGVGARILLSLGVDITKARKEILRLMGLRSPDETSPEVSSPS